MIVLKKTYDKLQSDYDKLQKKYDELIRGLDILSHDETKGVIATDAVLVTKSLWNQLFESLANHDQIMEGMNCQIRDLRAERDYYRLRYGELLATSRGKSDEDDKEST